VGNHEWRIERSSLPFRERHRLRPDVEAGTGSLVVDDLTVDGSPIRRIWQISSYEATSAKPLRQWLMREQAAENESFARNDSDPLPKFGAAR
jgi:hypothetical protein